MQVRLDECMPRRLRTHLNGHDVRTVHDLGWVGLKNGDLRPRASEAGIEAFVTVDRNIEFQLDLRSLRLGIVVLRAYSNDIAALLPLAPRLLAALAGLKPGQLIQVST